MISLCSLLQHKQESNQCEATCLAVAKPTAAAALIPIDASLAVNEKIKLLLSSSQPQQVSWAILSIQKLPIAEPETKKYASEIIKFFKSNEIEIKLAASLTAKFLLKENGMLFTPLFYKPVLETFEDSCYKEYLECLELMTTNISSEQIASDLIPLAEKLLEKDFNCQHIGSRILKIIPLVRVSCRKEQFSKYLNSFVFVNDYLPSVAQKFSIKFGDTWFSSELPRELLVLSEFNPKFNPGIINFLLEKYEKVQNEDIEQFISKMIQTGMENETIAKVLLMKLNILSKLPFADGMIELIDYTLTSPSASCRADVIDALGKCPRIIASKPNLAKNIFTAVSTDNNPLVRQKFLQNISEFYNCSDSPIIQDVLLNLYYKMFNEKEESVRNVLPNSFMLGNVVNAMNKAVIADILALATTYSGKWRLFNIFLKSFEDFPQAVVRSNLKNIMNIIDSALAINANAIKRGVVQFYSFCVQMVIAPNSLNGFLICLAQRYSMHQSYQFRVLYVKIALNFIDHLIYEIYIDYVWKYIMFLQSEKVSFVKEQILLFLPIFYSQFNIQTHFKASQQVQILLEKLKDDSPRVQELYEEARILCPASQALSSQQSEERLPLLENATFAVFNPNVKTQFSPILLKSTTTRAKQEPVSNSLRKSITKPSFRRSEVQRRYSLKPNYKV